MVDKGGGVAYSYIYVYRYVYPHNMYICVSKYT